MGVQETVNDGTPVEFAVIFTDPLGNKGDPAQVGFVYGTNVAGAVETTWVYGTNAQIERDGVGEYHAVVDTTGMAPTGDKAYLTGGWFGSGAGSDTLQGSSPASVLVLANAVTNPFPGGVPALGIDGGHADDTYLYSSNLDGGSADSWFLAGQSIDGGSA